MTNETMRERFWKMMDDNQFVKSTDSFTDEIVEYQPAITDMEAVVKINGEFDKYAIENWLEQEISSPRKGKKPDKEQTKRVPRKGV